MLLLIIGLLILIGIHLLPSVPIQRQQLINRLGETVYQLIFSVIALIGLIILIMGKAQAQLIPLWQPPAWGADVALFVMPLVFILLVAAYIPSHLKKLTPHPLLWGVILWALAHLLTNGDLASIILFASLAVFSVFDIISANKRGTHRSTAYYSWINDAVVVVLGLLFY
ncbi:MAG: NnrU family protein, partial [Pseudomonadota bacterium]|nr:NnrU family protein [Pseudomonadota bacterium]